MEAPAALKRFLDPGPAPESEIDVQLFSDEPISDFAADYFGFAAFALALAEIIDNEGTATPLTIALSAPWGAGKTSVARMIEADLRDRVADRAGAGRRIICEFNAWEHDDAPHLGAALAACVAKIANRHRPPWQRLLEPLPAAMLEPRERWWRVLCFGAIAALVTGMLLAFAPSRNLAGEALGPKEAALAGAFGVLWLAALVWGVIYRAGRNAARFLDDPGSEAARGSMTEVKKQLGRLIGQANRRGGRMVIFVDDLERCRAARAVEVFEVAGQLLAHRGVVTVLLADMRALAEAATAAYGGESGDEDPEMGRRYLEKLVQLELHLPPPASIDMGLLLGGEAPARGASGKTDGADEAEVEAEAERSGGPKVEPRRRLRGPGAPGQRVGLILGGILALFWGAAGIGVGASVGSLLILSLTVGTIAYGSARGIGTAWTLIDRWRRRRIAARVEETVRSHRDSIEVDDTAGESLIREAAGGERYEPLARRVAESVRTVESSEIEAVEAFIKSHPPRFPRGAKRMLNHARLLTKIAREREMLDDDLTPEHLGKWIVIGERWPWFAELVVADPADLGKLEDPFVPDRIAGAFPTDGSGKRDDELHDLIGADPKLAAVIERLIYFQSAPGSNGAAPIS